MLTIPKQRHKQLQGKGYLDQQGDVAVDKKVARKFELVRFIVVSSLHQTVAHKKSHFAEFSHFYSQSYFLIGSSLELLDAMVASSYAQNQKLIENDFLDPFQV